MKALSCPEAPITLVFSSITGGDTLRSNLPLILNPGLLLFFPFLQSHGIYIYSSSSFRKTISPQFLASCFPSLTECMTKLLHLRGLFLPAVFELFYHRPALPTQSPCALHASTNVIFLVNPWFYLLASHLPLGKLSAVSEIVQSAPCSNSKECVLHSELKRHQAKKNTANGSRGPRQLLVLSDECSARWDCITILHFSHSEQESNLSSSCFPHSLIHLLELSLLSTSPGDFSLCQMF